MERIVISITEDTIKGISVPRIEFQREQHNSTPKEIEMAGTLDKHITNLLENMPKYSLINFAQCDPGEIEKVRDQAMLETEFLLTQIKEEDGRHKQSETETEESR